MESGSAIGISIANRLNPQFLPLLSTHSGHIQELLAVSFFTCDGFGLNDRYYGINASLTRQLFLNFLGKIKTIISHIFVKNFWFNNGNHKTHPKLCHLLMF
jgi:hypothetical protein